MIQIFLARDGATMTFYVDHDEKQKVLTAFGKEDPPKSNLTGSDGETLLIDWSDVVGVSIYPPDLWEEKIRQKKAQAAMKKAQQQGRGALSPEERELVDEIMSGRGRQPGGSGGPSIVS